MGISSSSSGLFQSHTLAKFSLKSRSVTFVAVTPWLRGRFEKG
jgi:hypothetical protein